MSRKIGDILARLKLVDQTYQIDFSLHENGYDSDDEGHEWQWKCPIFFIKTGPLFLNEAEIPYDTVERYTSKIFWKDRSTSIHRMISDTMTIRKARGECMPDWVSEKVSKLCEAGDNVWYKHISKR